MCKAVTVQQRMASSLAKMSIVIKLRTDPILISASLDLTELEKLVDRQSKTDLRNS